MYCRSSMPAFFAVPGSRDASMVPDYEEVGGVLFRDLICGDFGVLVELLPDGSIQHLEGVFKDRHGIFTTQEEILPGSHWSYKSILCKTWEFP